jgi:N-acetylmuramoyl-L-alanine amidase
MRVGLIVGHKKDAPGACNKTHKICEYEFNDQLACDIYDRIKVRSDTNIEVKIIRRRTYKQLPSDVNAYEPDFCISLHCNAFNGKWNGSEVLYYHTSDKGKKMARILQDKFLSALGFKDRGILPRGTEDRGGYLLRYTNMPCVIAEPFFLDNDSAYEHVKNNYDALVNAYVEAIIEMQKLFI